MPPDPLDAGGRKAGQAHQESLLLVAGFFVVFLLAGLLVQVVLGESGVLTGALVAAVLILPPVWLLSRDRR